MKETKNKNKRKHQKKPENVSSSVGFTTLPTFDCDEEDEESREEEFLEFVKETAGATNVQKILSDLAENESVIDPETGMLISTGKLEFLHSKIKSIRGKMKIQ